MTPKERLLRHKNHLQVSNGLSPPLAASTDGPKGRVTPLNTGRTRNGSMDRENTESKE